MLKNHFLITIRHLAKHKLYVATNILGLAVAIGCCIVAYFAVEYDRNFDANHLNGKQLYRVTSVREFNGERTDHGHVPFPLGASVKENIRDVDKVIRYHYSWSNFKVGDDLFPAELGYADPEFPDAFTYEFLSGSASALNEKTSLLISDKMALRLFGTLDAVGKNITQVYGNELKELVVAAVFREQPQNSSFSHVHALLNVENIFDEFEDLNRDDWKNRATLFVQINDPNSVERVHQQLQAYRINNNQVREDFQIAEFSLDRFDEMAHRDRSLDTDTWTWSASPVSAVIGSSIMAVLILLIACFNLTNTSIAISSRRLKEIGIRKVMGSMKAQLVTQFIGETMVICLIALLLGLLFGELLVGAWNNLWEFMKLTTHYLDHPGFMIFLIVVLVLTALLAGSYPAFYVSRFEPISILRGKLKFGGTNYFTRVLLVLQYAISLIAIISAIAFYRNAIYQREYDLGFDIRGSVISYINDRGEFEAYRNALQQHPDILSIAGAQHSIFSNRMHSPVRHEAKQLEVDVIAVGDGYLETMGLTLTAGRDFLKNSRTDLEESVIITEKMAEVFNWRDPVGKSVIWQDTVKLYVVGVVKNVYTMGLWREMEPMMIRYTPEEKYTHLIVNTKAANVPAVNKYMESRWKEIFPNRLYTGRILSMDLAEVDEVNINILKMFLFLGIVALFLSATGLFSMVSLNIIKRMKEIGVRKVLGASVMNITRIINMEFVIILTLASVIGSYLGYLTVDMLMGSIWRYYQAATTVTFLQAVSVLFLVSFLAVGYKVYSAAAMNPVDTLKDE